MTVKQGAGKTPLKAAPRNLARLLAGVGGNAAFYSPYDQEASRELWDMLREEYDCVIEPDAHSQHYVRLRFEVEGVPVSAIFCREDVGVLTTVSADRYVIEGEVSA